MAAGGRVGNSATSARASLGLRPAAVASWALLTGTGGWAELGVDTLVPVQEVAANH
jgi:hypothetical protein